MDEQFPSEGSSASFMVEDETFPFVGDMKKIATEEDAIVQRTMAIDFALRSNITFATPDDLVSAASTLHKFMIGV